MNKYCVLVQTPVAFGRWIKNVVYEQLSMGHSLSESDGQRYCREDRRILNCLHNFSFTVFFI